MVWLIFHIWWILEIMNKSRDISCTDQHKCQGTITVVGSTEIKLCRLGKHEKKERGGDPIPIPLKIWYVHIAALFTLFILKASLTVGFGFELRQLNQELG